MTAKKDYEQLYYDCIYEIKKLKQENEYLKQDIYLQKNKKNINLRRCLMNEVCKYFSNKAKEE